MSVASSTNGSDGSLTDNSQLVTDNFPMPNFLPSTPQIALLVSMGLLIFMLWRRSNKHFGPRGKAYEPTPRVSKLSEDRDLALSDAPPEIARWQVEMYELSRELKGEIDTKLALLQVLTRHAQEAAARLEEATRRAEGRGPSDGRDSLDQLENWKPGRPEPKESVEHPQSQRIYALADCGATAASIAAETGISLGDVEMTLSLREQV